MTQTKNMKLPLKVLGVIFTLLLLTTMGELIYYFFFTPAPKTQDLPLSNIVASEMKSELKNQDPSQAIPNGQVDYIRNYRSDILQSSLLSNEHRGKIINIENKEGQMPLPQNEKLNYKMFLELEGSKGGINAFYYTDSMLAILQVVEGSGESEKEISTKDLHVGDAIIISETIDLVKPVDSGKVSLKITKL